MPKQVKGGKKRAREEKMVVGRMATRSITKAKKVGGQDKYISRDEALLYKKFQEWAQKHQKYYKTADEKKKRFEIWRSCKEWCEANTSHEPAGVKYGLNSRSDLTPSERGQLRSAGKKPPVDDAQKSSLEKSFWESESGKALTEAEAFDKWVAEHKRDYGDNKYMLLFRFMAYSRNYGKIKLLREKNPGCYLTLPDELDMKMDHVLTIPEFDRLVNFKGWSE